MAGALERHERIQTVAFDPAGRWIAAAIERQGLRLWDRMAPPDAAPIPRPGGRDRNARCGVRSERALDGGGGFGRCDVLADDAALAFVFRVSADQPRDVVFDPAGRWIAAASRLGGVQIWPLADGYPPKHFVDGVHVSTLTGSPDGKLLATGTRGKVLLLSVSDSRITELAGFESFVAAIAFDATGSRIAAAGRVSGRQSQSFASSISKRIVSGARSWRRDGHRQRGLSAGRKPTHVEFWRAIQA